MSVKAIQGQGDTTEWKERGLGAAFYIGLKIAQKQSWAKYYHFDLNSGGGHNKQIGCIGSPLAFVQASKDAEHKKTIAHFVDYDKQAVSELAPKLPNNCFCHYGDNASFISAIPNIIDDKPQYATGSILCDPNGTTIPFNELSAVLKNYPRMDIILNWNATAFLRCRKVAACKTENPLIKDLPELFNKKHWLIREPKGIHKFMLLVGRNVKTGDHRNLGFHDLDSVAGRQIVYHCDTTKAERIEQNQMPLPI